MIVEGIRCKHCEEAIWSKHRHDFHYCMCGKVAVDGGRDYLKVSYPTSPHTDHYETVKIDTDTGKVVDADPVV